MLNSKLDVITEAYYKDFKEKKADELWVIEDLDFTEADEPDGFKDFLSDNKIRMEDLIEVGPGGGNPNASFVGPKQALIKMVDEYFGGKDNSSDVVELYIEDPEKFHPYKKKAIKKEAKVPSKKSSNNSLITKADLVGFADTVTIDLLDDISNEVEKITETFSQFGSFSDIVNRTVQRLSEDTGDTVGDILINTDTILFKIVKDWINSSNNQSELSKLFLDEIMKKYGSKFKL